jgi:thioredoxin-like negative regulator of GroEL
VRVAKLNVDQHGDIAMRYHVQSIPTFILFKGGEVADRMLGAVPKAAFNDFLSRNS